MISVIFKDKHASCPRQLTPGSAGYDLYSCEQMNIPAGDRRVVSTGIILIFPSNSGFYGKIEPRSGLAKRFGIVANGGVVDPDFRGAVGVLLFNHSDKDFMVNSGMRIAQLVFNRYAAPTLNFTANEEEIKETERGSDGFGSTGLY